MDGPRKPGGFLKPRSGFATTAIHAGQEAEKWKSAAGFEYGRSGNPMRNTLEECLAALDGGNHGFAFASGLGAITSIVAMLSKGDHIVAMDELYGGTSLLFRNVISRLGIDVTFADITDLGVLCNALQDNTKMLWIETPTNPLMKVVDIGNTVRIVKRRGPILVVVDNTFLTPYLQRPLEFGADIVVYSLTKYMNGHSDVVMGAAVVDEQAVAEKLRFLQNAMGIVPSPFDCYLVNRSLKTLALRMEKHRETSMIVARYLERHPLIEEVMHPGLKSHKCHDIAKKQTAGHSGVFSFRHAGELEHSKKLLSGLKIFTLAESLGGYESLAELPSLMTHASVPEQLRTELGITHTLIRLSIGLEDAQDLVRDLDQALHYAFNDTDIYVDHLRPSQIRPSVDHIRFPGPASDENVSPERPPDN
ncbi:cystathionine gamma-lyase-like isoform X2 [Trichoplusia ni]|uniref:cystathionine gamma-lyase n=1 Tax=Trichoplusia ni TaxID=7111 RepID=A0A7E5WE85_TRINI|nr:cystathionine gamma-lyase-like isoform X2 [Trichoplusia ni]